MKIPASRVTHKSALLVPVGLGIPKRRADSTASLPFQTNLELSDEEMTEIDRRRLSIGWLMFAETERELEDFHIPNIIVDREAGQKSPSERLRAVIFRVWEQNVEGRKDRQFSQDSDGYYQDTMNRIISQFKEVLQ